MPSVNKEDEDTHLIAEALGEPYQFSASFENYDPKSLPRFLEAMHIATVNNVEIEGIREVVETIPVRNDMAHWSCQDHVIEILIALEQAKPLTPTTE